MISSHHNARAATLHWHDCDMDSEQARIHAVARQRTHGASALVAPVADGALALPCGSSVISGGNGKQAADAQRGSP